MSRVRKPKGRPKPSSRSAVPAAPSSGNGDLRTEIDSLVADADGWLNTPNDQFGGRAPADLLDTEEEHLLREWVGAVKHGMLS